MLMVTSPWDLCLPQRPRGLVPKFLGPGRQFRGGWFQRRKISISESEFQQIFQGCGCNNICHTILFFSSLTTDMNPATKRPRVPAGQPGKVYNAPGVSVYYFFLAFGWLLIPFRHPVYDSHEGRKPMANVGVHSDIGIIIRGRFILKQNSVLVCDSVARIVFFFHMQTWWCCWVSTAGCYFCIPWLPCFLFSGGLFREQGKWS